MTVHKPAQVLVVLSCLHTAMFSSPAPRAGERVYCMKCGGYRDAVLAPPDYSVECETCSYHRACGNAMITAETAAVKHTLRRPGHRVRMLDGTTLVRTYHHEPMPATVDLPPF